MPELPDLEVIRERLVDRVAGLQIVSAAVLRPIIVRNLLGGDAVGELTGRWITTVNRRGKFLLLGLDGAVTIAINPMLAGRVRHGVPLEGRQMLSAYLRSTAERLTAARAT